MNQKEVREIKKRLNPEKDSISRIYGCYVNAAREIVTTLDMSVGLMEQEEAELYFKLLKKTLSGKLGKNLLDIEFSANQVASGEKQQLLLKLRDSELADDEAVRALFENIREHTGIEGNYIIFLICDKYDVFSYSADGEKELDSSSMFTYILCSICPIKLTKPALSYYSHENKFHSVMSNSVVCAPELGFMYPVFDDRATNIYGTLMYTRNTTDSRDDFADNVFDCTVPMPAARQKETFENIVGETSE